MVSLLVAMRNEAGYIERCIRSLLAQDYPADKLEVFIFDGQSTDDSWQIAEQLIKNRPLFFLRSNPERIQSEAWNKGVAQSRGDVVGIVSAHSTLAPNYVSKAVEVLQRTKADMVGGPVRAQSENFIGEVIAVAMSTPFGVGGANFRYTDKELETDTVFMGLCRRDMYMRIGGFDEEMIRNQDDELSYRLTRNGGKIVCSPLIRSEYFSRSTLPSLWKQYYQYGYYKVRVLQKHPRQMRLRQFVPFAFVLALIVSALLAFISLLRPLSWMIPAIYILANLLASLYTAASRGWKYLPLLPIVFAILHLSYGLGFLAGLFKFWNRWNDREGKVPRFNYASSQ